MLFNRVNRVVHKNLTKLTFVWMERWVRFFRYPFDTFLSLCTTLYDTSQHPSIAVKLSLWDNFICISIFYVSRHSFHFDSFRFTLYWICCNTTNFFHWKQSTWSTRDATGSWHQTTNCAQSGITPTMRGCDGNPLIRRLKSNSETGAGKSLPPFCFCFTLTLR